MVDIDLGRFEALIFDLDGVITRTADLHAQAWKQLFDEYLARRAARTGEPFVPFDLEGDYRRYVDGKPRPAGVRSFLASRGIEVPLGAPGDDGSQETIHGLGKRKTGYFLERLDREGVQVFEAAVARLREARTLGVRTAVASSSRNCAAILRATHLTALFDARVDGVELGRLGLAGKRPPTCSSKPRAGSACRPSEPSSSRMRRPGSKPRGPEASGSSSVSAVPSTLRSSTRAAPTPSWRTSARSG